MFSPRILIADDDRALADALSMGLRQYRYRVDVCRDGTDAIQQARAVSYDVIVLDVQMPGDSGPEAQALLTDLQDIGDTPVIYITGDTSEGTRELCEGLGAYAIVYKPFDVDDLIESINEALRSVGRAA